jgi:hypothetical protein
MEARDSNILFCITLFNVFATRTGNVVQDQFFRKPSVWLIHDAATFSKTTLRKTTLRILTISIIPFNIMALETVMLCDIYAECRK